MEHTKKLACLLLAACLAVSLSACGGDKTWAMKRGDTTMPIGVYIYYLYQSFHQAAPLVSQNEPVLTAHIDGKTGETYIREQAYNTCRGSLWLDQKLLELGISLTEEELSTAQQLTDAQWAGLQESLTSAGVSKESFHQAYALYNTKYRKVFNALYGEGGTEAVSTEALTAYYKDNSYAYSFLFAPLYQTAEGVFGEALTETEETALRTAFESYQAQIEAGSTTLAEAGADFAAASGMETAPVNTMVNSKAYLYYPEGFTDALAALPDNGLIVLESEGNLVLLQKQPIDEAMADFETNASQRENVLLTMKGPEFSELILKSAETEITDVTVNTDALNSIKIESIIEPSMLLGTNPAAK